jgi:hypothetical protein
VSGCVKGSSGGGGVLEFFTCGGGEFGFSGWPAGATTITDTTGITMSPKPTGREAAAWGGDEEGAGAKTGAGAKGGAGAMLEVLSGAEAEGEADAELGEDVDTGLHRLARRSSSAVQIASKASVLMVMSSPKKSTITSCSAPFGRPVKVTAR